MSGKIYCKQCGAHERVLDSVSVGAHPLSHEGFLRFGMYCEACGKLTAEKFPLDWFEHVQRVIEMDKANLGTFLRVREVKKHGQ